LPKKITRSIAKELSILSQYKKDSWELHKRKHQNLCKKIKHANKDRNMKANKPKVKSNSKKNKNK